MKYREFSVQMPDRTSTLGVLGETYIYSPDESACAEKIVSQFDALAHEGINRFTRVDLAMLPFVPLMLAIAHRTNRSFTRRAKVIAEEQKKQITYLEPDMGESFSYKQLLAMTAVGFMSIPFAPLIYAYSKKHDMTNFFNDWEHDSHDDTVRFSRLKRFIKFAFEGNIAERDKKMAERTKAEVLSTTGNILHISGSGHTNGVISNLMALAGDDFRLTEVESSVTAGACGAVVKKQEVPIVTPVEPLIPYPDEPYPDEAFPLAA